MDCTKSSGASAPAQATGSQPPETAAERRVILDAARRARRMVLRQPPHYGRIGAQDERRKPCPVQTDADAALKVAQYDRVERRAATASRRR